MLTPTIRTWIARFGGLLAAAFLAADLAAAESAKAQRPNVLFIAIDDQNDWIGCLGGHPQVQTPHIDALAKRGTLFTNAHCQAPLCNPSRTSVMTGRRPSSTGIYALQPWFRTVGPLKDVVTLPQHFAANGYETLMTGKVHHDGYPAVAERGKEFTNWGHSGGYKNLPAKKFVETPDNIKAMDWGVVPERDEQQDDWLIADWAIGELKKPREKPFFLAVGFRHPHVPCYATQKWFDLYPADKLVMPPVKADDRADVPEFAWNLHWKLPEPRLSWLKKSGQWEPLVRAYLASVSFMDSQVGRVLETLEKSGQAENTIVVLWSDHGWHLGEKGITGKNSLWDRSTRVPLVFAGPGIAPDVRCSRPAELLDMYPTLIDLCNLPPGNDLEGHSLLQQLKDASAQREWPAITTHNQDNHGVRSENWRYIRYADGSEELYDERSDPNEWTNLAEDPKVADIIAEHRSWLPKVNVPAVPGSGARLLQKVDGVWQWEKKPIRPEEKVE